MRLSPRKFLGFLAFTLLAGNASAANPSPPLAPVPSSYPAGPGCATPYVPSPYAPSPYAPSPTAPSPTALSIAPNAAATSPNPESQTPNQGANENPYASAGDSSRSIAANSVTSAGTGLASSTGVMAAGGAGPHGSTVFTPTTFAIQSQPLILPGLFTAITAESARPVDRIFASYGYFDSFKIATPSGTVPGFNLNRFDIGAEKTIFDGMGSIYVRVPFLWATSNSSGQPIDGLGDVSAGIKFALLQNKETGSTFTVGMTVAAPTAPSGVSTTAKFVATDSSGNPTGGPAPLAPVTTSINPTIFQPWVGGLLVLDRAFVQEYLAVVIPSDNRVATFINNDIGIGYQLYRCETRESWLTSITPTLDVQTLLPINHQGTQSENNSSPLPDSLSSVGSTTNPGQITNGALQSSPGATMNSPYQVFVTAGVGLGLGERSVLSLGIVTPVTGPKAFTTGGMVGFNFFF